MTDYPFLAARNYTPGPRRNAIDLVVVHDMESDETIHTAEDCAAYFHNMPYDPRRGSSAHACADGDSIVETVHDGDIAWAAPSANHNGLHIEHAGRARQSRAEWLDDFGLDMLRRSADWVIEKCDLYDIPPVWLEAADLVPGARGITTHWATTIAYRIAGGHTDPGPEFPADVYMEFVRDAAKAKWPPPAPEVHPMYDPPLGPIVATCPGPAGLGTLALGLDGGVYIFDAPVVVPPGWLLGPNGQTFWGDRRPATIHLVDAGHWVVTATSGETYDFPAEPPE